MHGTDIRTASIIFTNTQKSPNSIALGAIRGLFYSQSKHNRYLAAILQRIHQAVIVVYGYAVDHSVPQLFVKLDGRSFKLFKFGEHTADGYGLGFLDDGDIDSCKKYMDGLYQTVESMGNLIQSGNSAIDYMINSKLSNLDGIKVLVSGFVGNYHDVDAADLACILGNIIDNAIEAQEKVEGERIIELHFLQKNASRIIICKNTVFGSVLNENRDLKSTKAFPEQHGLGHQIVETTVQKYRGWIDYFEEDHMFGAQIILPIPQ